MYIEKRWLVPGILTLLLFGALLAIALVLLGQRVPATSGSAPALDVSSAHQRPVHLTAARVEPDPATQQLTASTTLPPPPPAPETHAAAAAVPERPQPEEVVDIDTEKSVGTQINTRGFGDIGMQFQGVTINAPITNVHISNEGNNNATNVAVGDQNVVVSRQKDLESNRSDGAEPETTTAATGGERTTVASAESAPAKDGSPPGDAGADTPKVDPHDA